MHTITRTALSVCLLSGLLLGTLSQADRLAAEEKHPSERWKGEIQKFEKADETNPPPKNAILFVGSSSIRMWDLKKSFPELKVINRGFGGSKVEDSLYFIDQLVIKHEPKIVVLYAGDNDIAGGDSPEKVFQNFQSFASKLHKALPKTRLIYIAIKPSISRWKLIDSIRKANQLIQDYAAQEDWIEFADIDAPMLGEDGKPRPELFIKDGLHMSPEGYVVWAKILMPMLTEKE